MPPKRPIDIQREAAITLQVGGDDRSAAKEFLSTSKGLYVIKETGVFKIQLADDIDPDRINPSIPNLNQQVLAEGHNNKIVAKILLTAKYLFDEKNANVSPFVKELFENCLMLTQQILELNEMHLELAKEIAKKEEFLHRPIKPNATILPSILGLDTKLHNILSKADKAKDTLLAIARLHFLPETPHTKKLEELQIAIEKDLIDEPQLVASWREIFKFFSLIRNTRNASEHPKENYKIILNDFSMWPDGKVYPPIVEIKHPDTPIRSLPLLEFTEFIFNLLLEHAEAMLVLIRFACLIKNNPFGEWVAEFPPDQRRHKLVRYYRALKMGDKWHIIG